MGDLVVANVDYVMEILCRGLRQLAMHPRTPALFVAVLRRADVTAQLLPLLQEAVRPAPPPAVHLVHPLWGVWGMGYVWGRS